MTRESWRIGGRDSFASPQARHLWKSGQSLEERERARGSAPQQERMTQCADPFLFPGLFSAALATSSEPGTLEGLASVRFLPRREPQTR